MIRGIDVSSYQGKIDWPNLVRSTGIRFALIKCSEGNRGSDPVLKSSTQAVDARRASRLSGKDPRFDENAVGAAATGLYVGPYHFADPRPDNGVPLRGPNDQAAHAFECSGGVGARDGQLPPMLDLEWPPPDQWKKWGCSAQQIRAWALDWLASATAYWSCKPLLYTYPYFWHAIAAGAEPEFEQYKLVLASYPSVKNAHWPVEGESPIDLPPWGKSWTMWQFTGGGMLLPGTNIKTDYDVFNGDEKALEALCSKASGDT